MTWRIPPPLARRLAVATGALLFAVIVAALAVGISAGSGSPPGPCPWMTPLEIRTVAGGTPLYIWDKNEDGTADGYSLATPLPCIRTGGASL